MLKNQHLNSNPNTLCYSPETTDAKVGVFDCISRDSKRNSRVSQNGYPVVINNSKKPKVRHSIMPISDQTNEIWGKALFDSAKFMGQGSKVSIKDDHQDSRFCPKNSEVIGSTQDDKEIQCYNEDSGILQHVFKESRESSSKKQYVNFSKEDIPENEIKLEKKYSYETGISSAKDFIGDAKVRILFGFSLEIDQIKGFHNLHPELKIKIKVFKYGGPKFFKQCTLESLTNEEQVPAQLEGSQQNSRISCPSVDSTKNSYAYDHLINDVLEGEDFLDCEELTFVLEIIDNDSRHSLDERESKLDNTQQNIYEKQVPQKSLISLLFFPHINALKSQEEKRELKTSRALAFDMSLTPPDRSVWFADEAQKVGKMSPTNQMNCTENPKSSQAVPSQTSIRKSHQNFRILQVLQYYMQMECHSDHITVSPNESKVIKYFLDLVYEAEVTDFKIYIDHEKKTSLALSKTTKNLKGSVSASKLHSAQKQCQKVGGTNAKDSSVEQFQTGNTTSTEEGDDEFITIDGEIVMNDEFICKLSEISVPPKWLQSVEFRKAKKEMYRMKLQESSLLMEIRDSKTVFVDNINYLNGLVGLPKISYEQISVKSLNDIKNAKIRQNTKHLKELLASKQNLSIRFDNLKAKKAEFESEKLLKTQEHADNLIDLRSEIIDLEKKLTVTKNHLSTLCHTESQTPSSPSKQCTRRKKSLKKQNFDYGDYDKEESQPEKNKTEKNDANFKKSSQKVDRPVQRNSGRHTTFNGRRNSCGRKSFIDAEKYSGALERLRKEKYQKTLQLERTRCEFQAERDYEKLKMQYRRASDQLRLILNDCD